MKFAKNIQWNRLFFTDCFLAKFPQKFPVKSADFSKNFDFTPAKIMRNGLIFEGILTFFPAKIQRNRPIFPRICPWKCREILLFFPRNIRSPVNLTNCLININILTCFNAYHIFLATFAFTFPNKVQLLVFWWCFAFIRGRCNQRFSSWVQACLVWPSGII